MGGSDNPEEGKFNFKVKITQTDLACQEYLFGAGLNEGFGFGFDGDPSVYQNSDYISKLYFINNYSGGILAKDKLEEMPDRYKWFVQTENPTEAEIIRTFKKEMTALANREEIGQNVFYSGLSAVSNAVSVYSGSSGEVSQSDLQSMSSSASAYLEYIDPNINGGFEDFGFLGSFQGLFDGENFSVEAVECIENASESLNEAEINAEIIEEYYKDDEEIRNILLLNNVYNSEMYKMSKVEYDFSVSGDIIMTEDGLLNIKYDESEITGLRDSYIQFLFKTDNRDILTIRRKHFMDVWFTLEKGRRVSIERRGQYSSEILTTSTKELVNNMTVNGGDMRILYTMETDGIPMESVLYLIHAEPVDG